MAPAASALVRLMRVIDTRAAALVLKAGAQASSRSAGELRRMLSEASLSPQDVQDILVRGCAFMFVRSDGVQRSHG